MTSTMGGVPDAALKDIAYLSRSDNRVLVLDALTAGPHTRRELEEVTGVSRATLGRIVNEFEDRNWAERTSDGDYVATSTGHHIATQFTPFAESIEAIRRLGEAVEWLPIDELSIGLHHFSDAFVKQPDHDDPMEIIDYFTDQIRDATEIRVLTHLAPPEPFAKSMYAGITADRLTGTFVLRGELVDYLGTRSARQQRWREFIEAGADVYRYDGDIPCNLLVIDDTVFIKSSRSDSVKLSYAEPIVSENETVQSWAYDVINTYQNEANHVISESL